MTQCLAPSTRKVYASAQRHFLDFYAQDNSLSPSGSALLASEEVLIRFCCHPADTIHHSSVKVYLSAIRSLHVEEGHPSPLVGCLGYSVCCGVSNVTKAEIGVSANHHNRADAHYLPVLERL